MNSCSLSNISVNLTDAPQVINITSPTSIVIEGIGSGVINISEGERVDIVDLSTSSNIEINMSAHSQAKVVTIKLQDGTTSYVVNQVGQGANIDIYGATIATKSDRIEVLVNMNHNSKCGTSSQLIKSIGCENSNTKFEGRIYIAQGSSSISAMQQNKNLLLSSSAQIESNPWLEIYNDDVKCSHGSTTGVLDEDEIFYMRQRGISLPVARALQIEGFIVDISNHISCESLRELTHDKLVKVIEKL